jgi:dTDP-4-amino-4,6-dideoxygalactose transaminase
MSNAPSTVRRVPFVKPKEHYRALKSEIDGAILSCLENGDLIHRRQLFDFEKNLAAYVGTKYAVGLASGYHALLFGLMAAKVGPGDEVITVAHTFAASVSAIVHAGAKPILIDVRDDYNMDVRAMEAALTSRTKAIMPVHLNGRVCEMDTVMSFATKHRLAVIEDACQALGARFDGKMGGSFATGCFSFYPFKSLGGFGDGGALTTNDPDVARFATLMRYNGEDRQTGEFFYHGHTALLDNVQAAVLDVKLRHFPAWVEHRRAISAIYTRGLAGLRGIRVPVTDGGKHRDAFQNYVIRAASRDALRAHLTAAGVETLISWPKPMWEHVGLNLGTPDLPETSALCREVISLPLSAETTPEEAAIVVDAVRGFLPL